MINKYIVSGLLVELLIILVTASVVNAQDNKEKVEIYTFYSHVYDYYGYEKVEKFLNTLSFEKWQEDNQVVFQYIGEKNDMMLFELSFDTLTTGLWIIDNKDTLYLKFLDKKEYIFLDDDVSHSVYKYLSIGHGTGKSYLFFISEEFGFLMYRFIFEKWYVELLNHSGDEDSIVNILISLIRNDKEFYFSR